MKKGRRKGRREDREPICVDKELQRGHAFNPRTREAEQILDQLELCSEILSQKPERGREGGIWRIKN